MDTTITGVLFIQGAGEGSDVEDMILKQDLQKELGLDFEVIRPEMGDEADAPYYLWKKRIQEEITVTHNPIILVGHSLGASELMRVLTEIRVETTVVGVFLLVAPFWGGRGGCMGDIKTFSCYLIVLRLGSTICLF